MASEKSVKKEGKIKSKKVSGKLIDMANKRGFIFTISVIILIASIVLLAQASRRDKQVAGSEIGALYPTETSAYISDNVKSNLKSLGFGYNVGGQPLGTTFIYHNGTNTTFTTYDSTANVANSSYVCRNVSLNLTESILNLFAYQNFVQNSFANATHTKLALTTPFQSTGNSSVIAFLCPSDLGDEVDYTPNGAGGEIKTCFNVDDFTILAQSAVLICNETFSGSISWQNTHSCSSNCVTFGVNLTHLAGSAYNSTVSDWVPAVKTNDMVFADGSKIQVEFFKQGGGSCDNEPGVTLHIPNPPNTPDCTFYIITTIYDPTQDFAGYTVPFNVDLTANLNYTQSAVNKYSKVA